MPIEWIIGLVFLAVFVLIWLWQNPGVLKGPMSAAEIEHYLQGIVQLPYPAEERLEVLARLRAWMQSDDGKPVYMLNLMRFYKELRRFNGSTDGSIDGSINGSIDFRGTPQDSNARYEATVIPLLFRLGAYPVFAGSPQGLNLMSYEQELDHWSRVLVVRYPDRRAFLNLMTHPEFRRVVPLKLMALKVMLTPMRPQLAMPELPVIAAATLLPLFLAIGWWIAAHAA